MFLGAKKSLGQNFLKSKSIIEDIINSSEIKNGDIVLEIGPGKGILTEELLKKTSVIGVEKDGNLINYLNDKFKNEIDSGKLKLIHGDILNISVKEIVQENYKLIANIPYYITGALFRKILSCENKPESITVMVQKEVAKRIVSQNKKESILSMSIKVYGEPKYIKKVPARYFSPKPKVDSAILYIKNISSIYFEDISEKLFFKILNTGFAHKRKLLIRNLEVLYSLKVLNKVFESCSVSLKTRAENLTRENWKCLVIELQTNGMSRQ